MVEYITRNERETEELGAKLAAVLKPGMIIAFTGGLGMGKTAFTRGIAYGLGYTGRVSSPTFTIVQEYIGGRLPLFHFDWYRIQSAEELYNLGWEEYWDRGGVCVIEWSEQAPDALPTDVIQVKISRANDHHINHNLENTDDNSRLILVEGIEIT